MAPFDRASVPEQYHESVQTAFDSAFGERGVKAMSTVTGGALGALIYRLDSADGPHLLRIETLRGPLRNPHQHECMQIAAEAGIAPPVRYLDDDAGVVVMPFLSQRPLSDYPGGPPALASAAAELLARLHETTTFPAHGDHLDNLARMLAFLEASGRVAPGLLDRHKAAFHQIRAVYPWKSDSFVSCHNDPNQQNLLFDGERLWLIDWETASRSDPFIDAATVASYIGTTPDLCDLLLGLWLRRPPEPLDRARLALMTLITQLYAGCILLLITADPATTTHTDLTSMSIDRFRAAVEHGDLPLGTPTMSIAFAKLVLGMFIGGLSAPDFEDALRVAAAG